MRFSLATLLLLILFIASLMAVWFRREPWYIDKTSRTLKDLEVEFGSESKNEVTPDGTRTIEFSSDPKDIKIQSTFDNSTLFRIPYTSPKRLPYVFLPTDDAIVIYPFDLLPQVYRRRFPEWWWGHFYRPEVWLSLAFGITLLVHAFRTRRRKVWDA